MSVRVMMVLISALCALSACSLGMQPTITEAHISIIGAKYVEIMEQDEGISAELRPYLLLEFDKPFYGCSLSAKIGIQSNRILTDRFNYNSRFYAGVPGDYLLRLDRKMDPITDAGRQVVFDTHPLIFTNWVQKYTGGLLFSIPAGVEEIVYSYSIDTESIPVDWAWKQSNLNWTKPQPLTVGDLMYLPVNVPTTLVNPQTNVFGSVLCHLLAFSMYQSNSNRSYENQVTVHHFLQDTNHVIAEGGLGFNFLYYLSGLLPEKVDEEMTNRLSKVSYFVLLSEAPDSNTTTVIRFDTNRSWIGEIDWNRTPELYRFFRVTNEAMEVDYHFAGRVSNLGFDGHTLFYY